MDERIAFVNGIIKDKNSRILEIGPLNRPIVMKNEYPNSFTCDIRSTEQVKELYTSNEYLETTGISIDVGTIVDIDYVLDESYQNTFLNIKKFDYVIASHVMEHMEDIIGFLLDITSVLEIGGKLCIIYPDKRYCFDHFRESASFRDAYDVYERGSIETARMAFDFFNTSVDENNESVFWNAQNIHSLISKRDSRTAMENYHRILNGEKMDDVHFWPFTDHGFLMFLYDCIRAKLLPFSCEQFHPTKEYTQQFYVELRYDPNIKINNQTELQNLLNTIEKIPLDYFNSKYINLEKLNSELYSRNNELTIQNEDQKKVNSALIENNNALSANNQMLSVNNQVLSEKNLVLDTRNAEMANTIGILKVQYETFLNNINDHIEKYVLSEQNRLRLEEMNRSLREQFSSLTNQLKATRATLDIMEQSSSWKITKPIRLILDLIKQLIK